MNLPTSRLPYEIPTLSVTELVASLYEVTQQLNFANKELLELHQEQSSLLTNLSHDLRSPISAIHGAIDYIQTYQQITDTDTIACLKLIQAKTQFIEKLIEDIFLLSQIQSKSWNFNYQLTNIGMFLEEFYFNYQYDINFSKRSLILEVPPHFPYEAVVDTTLLYRLLDNLMNNALKYSSDYSSILLGAKLHTTDTILVYVQDYGIGIAQEYLTKIFDRSFTISTARTPGPNSSNGLGLSIAKSIVEQHQGDIWCESKLGFGSTFCFTLPILNNLGV